MQKYVLSLLVVWVVVSIVFFCFLFMNQIKDIPRKLACLFRGHDLHECLCKRCGSEVHDFLFLGYMPSSKEDARHQVMMLGYSQTTKEYKCTKCGRDHWVVGPKI